MPRQTPLAILVSTTVMLLVSICTAQAQQEAKTSQKPKITDIRIVSLSLPTAEGQVTFELVIEGENFNNAMKPTVSFDYKDPASPGRDVSVVSASSTEIRVRGTAKVGTEITRVVVGVGNESAEATKGFILNTPKITNVRIVSLPPTNNDKVTFVLGIEGENFPDAERQPEVLFYTTDAASPVSKSPISRAIKNFWRKSPLRLVPKLRV